MSNKNVLILKTGSTMPVLLSRRGDFDYLVISGMRLDTSEVLVVDATKYEPFPSPEKLSGVVITGSHEMVTEYHDWSERVAKWLPGIVEQRIPVLAICYGHQLLAHSLGGKIGDNPKGREYGTVDVFLETSARRDRLFEGFESPIAVHVSHAQSILELPAGATLLAANATDPHHAFVYGDCAWGVQFHPEFDADVTREYIHHHEKALQAEGQNPAEIFDNCRETTTGPRLLERFARIVKGTLG